MELAIDANSIVSELAGSERFDVRTTLLPPALDKVFIASYTWTEAMQVLDNRFNGWVHGGRVTEDHAQYLETAAKTIAALRCIVIEHEAYARREAEARLRIPGDTDDWHTVAVALTLEMPIWTLDKNHFFGCGLAVWNTNVLRNLIGASIIT